MFLTMTNKASNTLRYTLLPSPDDEEAIIRTLEGYRRAMAILDETSGANLVALHEEAYEAIRSQTGIPSRLATLALRDHGRRVPGDEVMDLPLDGKLFSIKGPETLSLATVAGRRTIAYSVAGYSDGWEDFAEARLRMSGGGIQIDVGTESGGNPRKGRIQMAENMLSRIGRIIAGTAHGAVDAIEDRAPRVVAEQALREIDRAIEDAKGILGKAQAQEYRIKAKIRDIDDEIADIEKKVAAGLAQGREDLAKPALGLQIDLEAQRSATGKALEEAQSEIRDATLALGAAQSARADASARVAALIRSETTAREGSDPRGASQRNDDRIARSLAAVERATGTPGRPVTAAAEIEELARIQRDAEVEKRLKALKREGL